MADNDSLLDVFVNVQPHPDSVNALNAHLRQVVDDATRAFSQLGVQANAIAQRAEFVRNGGRGGGGGRPSGPSTEEQQAQQAQQQFASLRRQLSQDIANLRTQLNGLSAKGLITELNAAQVAIRSIGEQVVNLDAVGVGGRQAQLEIEQRTEQLLEMRRVLEGIQERAAIGVSPDGSGIERSIVSAKDEARLLQQELRVAKAELAESTIRPADFAENLEQAHIALQQILLELNQIDDADFGNVNIERYLERLGSVRSTLQETRANTKVVVDLEKAGRDEVNEALLLQKRQLIEIRQLERSTGAVSAEAKRDIASLRAEIERANLEMARSRAEITQNGESWENYRTSVDQVTAAQQRLIGKFNNIQTAGGVSFNTLGNNMYQLGQAFEDAAIGYQLNGIAGAVRGASNNVSFLLNNLSQVPSVQKAIATQFGIMNKTAAVLLPTTAAFASVIAITVLPKMFEWLASLDDIEYELDDLSDRFQRDFSDLDVEVKISLDERQFRRDVARLETVREILEAINKLQDESEDIFFNVRSNIDELQQGRTSRIFRNQFNDFSRQLSEQVKELETTRDRVQQAVRVGRPPATVGGFAVPSGQINFERQQAALGDLESTIGQFKNIQALISGITSNIAELQEKSSRGVLDSSQLIQTRDLLARLSESITSGAEKLTKADGSSLEGATETIGQLQREIEDLIVPAQQFESIVGEQLQAALDATIRKTEQLAAKQQLFRQQIAGTSNEYDVLLFDLSELSKTYEDLIRNTVKFAQDQNRSQQEIIAVKNAIEAQAQQAIENQLLTGQLDLIEKIRSAEEKLAQLRQRKESGESRRTSLERFTSQLQEAALSIGGVGIDKNTQALKDATEELEKLRNALNKTNEVQEILNSGGGSMQIQEIALMQPIQRQTSAMIASGLGGQIGGILGAIQLAQPTVNLAQARGRFEDDQLRASEWRESFESALRNVLRTESVTIDETRQRSSQQPKIQAIGP